LAVFHPSHWSCHLCELITTLVLPEDCCLDPFDTNYNLMTDTMYKIVYLGGIGWHLIIFIILNIHGLETKSCEKGSGTHQVWGSKLHLLKTTVLCLHALEG